MSGKFSHVRKPKPMKERIVPRLDSPGFFYTPPKYTQDTPKRKSTFDSSILNDQSQLDRLLENVNMGDKEVATPKKKKSKKKKSQAVTPKSSNVSPGTKSTLEPTNVSLPTSTITAVPPAATATSTVAGGPQLQDEKEAIDMFSEKSQITPIKDISDIFADIPPLSSSAGSSVYASNADSLARKLDLNALNRGTDESYETELQDKEEQQDEILEDVDLSHDRSIDEEEKWTDVVNKKMERRLAKQNKQKETPRPTVCEWLSPTSYRKATGGSSSSAEPSPSSDSEYVPTPHTKQIERGSPPSQEIPSPKNKSNTRGPRQRNNKGKAKSSPPPSENQDFR